MASHRTRGRTCDRASCPAPAVRELTLAGQDFYFCNHHAVELETALAERSRGHRDSAHERRLVGAGPPHGR